MYISLELSHLNHHNHIFNFVNYSIISFALFVFFIPRKLYVWGLKITITKIIKQHGFSLLFICHHLAIYSFIRHLSIHYNYIVLFSQIFIASMSTLCKPQNPRRMRVCLTENVPIKRPSSIYINCRSQKNAIKNFSDIQKNFENLTQISIHVSLFISAMTLIWNDNSFWSIGTQFTPFLLPLRTRLIFPFQNNACALVPLPKANNGSYDMDVSYYYQYHEGFTGSVYTQLKYLYIYLVSLSYKCHLGKKNFSDSI